MYTFVYPSSPKHFRFCQNYAHNFWFYPNYAKWFNFCSPYAILFHFSPLFTKSFYVFFILLNFPFFPRLLPSLYPKNNIIHLFSNRVRKIITNKITNTCQNIIYFNRLLYSTLPDTFNFTPFHSVLAKVFQFTLLYLILPKLFRAYLAAPHFSQNTQIYLALPDFTQIVHFCPLCSPLP